MRTRNSNSSDPIPCKKKKVSDEDTLSEELLEYLPCADVEDDKVLKVFGRDAAMKMEVKTVDSLLNIKKKRKLKISFNFML